MKEQILVVDDEKMIRDLLNSAFMQESYVCYLAENVDDALAVLAENEIDLVVSDIMMPGKSGVDLLRELKTRSSDIAVLMITGLNDMKTAMECIHLGADDYIAKPFSISRVVLTVKNILEKRVLEIERRDYQKRLEFTVMEQTAQLRSAMHDLNNSYNSTLSALVKALDAREKEVGSHSERVMELTILLAGRLRIEGKALENIAKGALLHDIGKIGIPDNILLKPGKLDETEWTEMRKHPAIGHAIMSDIKIFETAAEIILTHHERFDGTGYPRGLKGSDIPIGGRIFAVVDTLDAMTSDRPYRKALPFDEVVREVVRCRGTQFDPEIADLFLSIPKNQLEECVKKKFL